MRAFYLAAAIFSVLAACGAPAEERRGDPPSADRAAGDSRAFIPAVGTHASRTMLLMIPRQVTERMERMMAAVRQRPDWFADWSANHRNADRTLRYHPNLGISEEDHRLIQQSVKHMQLQEVERGALTVTRRDDGGIALSSTGRAAYLNGVVIHPDKDFVETRHGRLKTRTAINQTDPNAPTGPWRGVQWSDDNEGRGPVVKLAVGKRAAGETIIYYDVEPSADETLVLLYE